MRNALVVLLLTGCVVMGVVLARGPGSAEQGQSSVESETPGILRTAIQDVGEQVAETVGRLRPEVAVESGKRAYFQYVDERGTVHFADSLERVPEEWRDRVGRIELAGTPPSTPAEAQAARARSVVSHPRPFAYAPEPEAPKVVVYTTRWCGWCRKTLAHLDRRGVQYQNRDIESDREAADRLLQLTGSSAVPMIEIGDDLVRGYDPTRIDALLD